MPAQITEKLVTGDKELQDAFRKLSAEMQATLGNKILMAGAKVVQKYANAKAPRPEVEIEMDDAGGASKSANIGIKGKFWRWRFSEYGVQPFEVDLVKGRTKRTSGKGRKIYGAKGVMHFNADGMDVFTQRIKRGGVSAKPFMRPAIDNHEDEILGAMADELQKGLDSA